MAIIGGPDAGKVDWHPSVLEEARKTGLSVDDEGNLIMQRKAVVRKAALTELRCGSFRQREADLVPCLNSMRPTFVRYQRLISGR